MSSYTIDYSEPLKTGFTILAGGFNGPGGSAAATTLRLYGRGALEWGEAVDEDLVRLTESFASASAPSSAISGQLWNETTLYYRDTTSANVLNGWYRYTLPTTLAGGSWALLNGTGVVPGAAPASPTIGQYYYGTRTVGTLTPISVTGLWGWYSLGRYEPAAWVLRSSFTGTGAPVGVVPPQTLRIRDGNILAGDGQWVTPSSIAALPTAVPPSAPQIGQLWFVTDTGHLKLWNGLAWQDILGPTFSATTVASGPVDLGGSKITSLATPTAGTDAANKAYVDSAIIAGGAAYVLKTGDTMTGSLNIAPTTGTASLALSRTSISAGQTSISFNGGVGSSTWQLYQQANGDDLSFFNSVFASNVMSLTSTGNVGIANGLTVTAGINAGGTVVAGGQISGPSMSISGAGQIGGGLGMVNTKIQNLANPTAPQDAATKAYVDAEIAGGAGAYLPLTGGTLAGPGTLTVNGTLTTNGAVNLNAGATATTLTTSGAANLNSLGVSGNASVTGTLTAGGLTSFTSLMNLNTNRIANVAAPVNPGDAVNKTYADTKLTVVASTAPYLTGSGTPASPLAINVAALAAVIFSSLTCTQIAALVTASTNCGTPFYVAPSTGGGIGPGGIGSGGE